MPLQTGLLYNPLSGFNRRHPGALVEAAQGRAHVQVHAVRNPIEVQLALEDLARQGTELLVICGGDGTVQAVVTALLRERPFVNTPALVVLAAGTTNMIAADAGLPGNPLANLLRVLSQNSLASMGCVTRSVLRMQIPGQEDRYGMFLGMAAISQGIQYYQEHLHNQGWQGLPGICLTLLRALLPALSGRREQLSTRLEIAVNGEQRAVSQLSGNVLLALITTHERLLFDLRPFWGERTAGPLRCTLVQAQAKGMFWRLPFLALGQGKGKGWVAGTGKGYHCLHAHSLKLWLDGPLALDGELYSPRDRQEPVSVSCGGKLNFVRRL